MSAHPKSRSSTPKKKKRKLTPNKATNGEQSYPTQSLHEIMAASIAEEQRKAAKNRLKSKKAHDCYELMRESYATFDSLLEEVTLDPPLACEKGCIYCCINQVSMTEPEALFLGFHLLETRNEKQLIALEEKTRALLTKLAGKSRQEIGMERHLHPCIFLEDGTCSIYNARPLVCRGWNSVNADMCKHSNQTGDALAPIENHPLPRVIADSVQLGILGGAKEMGLETGYLLLPRAVYLLLEGGAEKQVAELTQRWLEGAPFFARKINL